MSPVKANKEALEAAEKKVAEANKLLTGVGLRHRAGQTRGKNPSVIEWMAFDTDTPETLPKDLKGTQEIIKADEATLVSYIIDGYNSAAYGLASDELYEHVEDSWPDDVKSQFRLTVRNFAKMTGKPIEEVVGMVKPNLEAALKTKAAEEAEKAAKAAKTEEVKPA